MNVVKDPKFNEELKVILRFIALDSKPRAINFKNELITKVNNLPYMPICLTNTENPITFQMKTLEIIYLRVMSYPTKLIQKITHFPF